jgi:hypothetical protein
MWLTIARYRDVVWLTVAILLLAGWWHDRRAMEKEFDVLGRTLVMSKSVHREPPFTPEQKKYFATIVEKWPAQ